jgi:hypothetical protein
MNKQAMPTMTVRSGLLISESTSDSFMECAPATAAKLLRPSCCSDPPRLVKRLRTGEPSLQINPDANHPAATVTGRTDESIFRLGTRWTRAVRAYGCGGSIRVATAYPRRALIVFSGPRHVRAVILSRARQ